MSEKFTDDNKATKHDNNVGYVSWYHEENPEILGELFLRIGMIYWPLLIINFASIVLKSFNVYWNLFFHQFLFSIDNPYGYSTALTIYWLLMCLISNIYTGRSPISTRYASTQKSKVTQSIQRRPGLFQWQLADETRTYYNQQDNVTCINLSAVENFQVVDTRLT